MHPTQSVTTVSDASSCAGAAQDPASAKVSRFWDAYSKAMEKQGVKASARRWYVVHVEQYIKAAGGRKLATHGPDDVRGYLEARGRSTRGEDWQLAQVADAIRILFAQVMGARWSGQVDWSRWAEGARSLPATHPTVARDYDESVVGDQGASVTSGRAVAPADSFPQSVTEAVARVVAAIRGRHYSIRTEQAYVGWIQRFVLFNGGRKPGEMGAVEVKRFLEDLVVRGKVSASTQNQALNALVFLYDKVLEQPIGELGTFARSKRPRRLPVVLSRAEVTRLLDALGGVQQLMAGLLYGSGLRLMECVRLRVQDVDFDYHQLLVRNGKGGKDRVVPLPQRFAGPLKAHLEEVGQLHRGDLAAGLGDVYLPDALARKYPRAAKEWGWQYVFPSSRVSVDPRSGQRRRHHIHENGLQKAVKKACAASGITKKANCHSLRHYAESRIMPSIFLRC